MKTIYTWRVPVEEALHFELDGDSLSCLLVDMAWERAILEVPDFQELDDAGNIGETTVRLDGTNFVTTIHDLC